MRTVIPPVLLVASLVVVPANASAQENSLKKMVLAEYPAALRELESRFARASGLVRAVREDKSRPDRRRKDSLYLFDSMRPRMARVRIQRPTPGPNGGTIKVFCYSTDYSFLLQRGGEKREYYIMSLEKGANNSSHIKMSMYPLLDYYLDAPYVMDGFPLITVFNDPKFSLVSVSPVIEKHKNMLRLVFNWPLVTDRLAGGGYDGSLLVSPAEKWVLHEYEYRPKNGLAIRKGVIDYGEVQVGFPVPKRVVTSVFDIHKKQLREVRTYDFEEFRFVDVPAQEFTLAAFGLPEGVVRPGKVARTSKAGYWFFGLAFVALGVSVAVKSASSRLQKRPPSEH